MKAVCCIIAGMKKDLEQNAFRDIVDQFIHEDEGDDISRVIRATGISY